MNSIDEGVEQAFVNVGQTIKWGILNFPMLLVGSVAIIFVVLTVKYFT